MILVDSSAWIEYDRATSSWVDETLIRLIEQRADIAVTQPVIMEVLAGARGDAHSAELARMLAPFTLLTFDAASDFIASSVIYRRCRVAGVTPRGLLDCMILAVAQRHGAQVLSADRDFSRIGAVIGVDVLRPAENPEDEGEQ